MSINCFDNHVCYDKNLCLPVNPQRVPDRGMGEYFFNKMKENSDKVAQIDSITGRKEIFGDLLSRCIRTAQTLQARGITPDDVVTLCTLNNMDYTVPYVACIFLNVKVACVDPTSPLDEIVHQVKLVSPKIMFCEEDSVRLVEATLKKAKLDIEVVVFGETDKHTPFSDFLVNRGFENDFQVTPVKDVYSTFGIMFSSGTTGLPKGTCVTHYAMYYNNFIPPSERFMLDMSSVMLTFTSPYWTSNISFLTSGILNGFTRVICRKFDENTAIKLIQDYKVNSTFFTPINLDPLIKNPQYCDYDTSKLHMIFIGGSVTSTNQFLELFKLFPQSAIFNGYGMTEVGGVLFRVDPLKKSDININKRFTVGRPRPGLCYKVVDDDENHVGPNTNGELRVKYHGLMNAYYNQPELYAKAFDDEGFLKTGDLVYYDENYKFYIIDRLKEIFKYRSWHISPTLIESELLTHPDVKHAAVIGIPDEKDGELPTAAVVLQNGASTKPEEIVKYVNDRMADRYHLRGGVYIVDSIPVTPSEKIRRRDLRDMILKLGKK